MKRIHTGDYDHEPEPLDQDAADELEGQWEDEQDARYERSREDD